MQCFRSSSSRILTTDVNDLQLLPPLTHSIGSTEWTTKLSETERVESIKPILNALALTNVKDVHTLICKYRDLIQPLDNIPFKRGYRWRDMRFIGQQKSQAFSDIIIKFYEPIICAVVEEMNLKNVDIWTASDSLEQMRWSNEIQGVWKKTCTNTQSILLQDGSFEMCASGKTATNIFKWW